MSKIKVITKFNSDLISQEVLTDDADISYSHISKTCRRIVNLQDEGVRKALIALGWTPPDKIYQFGETSVEIHDPSGVFSKKGD